MTDASAIYEGTWRKLVNLAAESAGSIHDDATAQAMGFEGGFVPGSTVASAGFPAIVNRYGRQWFEGGWFSFKFITPVYTHEEVREVAEPSGRDDDITISIVNREGRVASVGRAGLGTELGPLGAWDPGVDGTSDTEGHMGHLQIGADYGEIRFTVGLEQVSRMLEAAGDASDWLRTESPWGRPVVAPEQLVGVGMGMSREELTWGDEARGPLIWAEHSVVTRRPLFLDEQYRMTSRLADKGRSGRTVFVQTEFAVSDESGAELARGRQKLKRFAVDAKDGPVGGAQ